MVATRNHPVDFDEPATASPTTTATGSPRKRSNRASTADHATPTKTSPPPTIPKPRFATSTAHRSTAWSHTPSNLTLIWLAISLPLVVWDTGYVVLRPYSMPGGFLHKPIWAPYGYYGTVDKMYGFEAIQARTGWTAAQGSINALETIAYAVYLYLVYTFGKQEPRRGTGAPAKSTMGTFRALSESRTVHGRVAAAAVLLAFSTASLTFWKTVLYWLNEAFTGFDNIGHNDFLTLFFVWIIPNGAWLVFPAYMMYVFGKEILDGLEASTARKSR